MSRQRIYNPLTGKYTERRIRMRWTIRAKLLMTLGALLVFVTGYFANFFYDSGDRVASAIFCAFFGVAATLMFRLYRAIRLWSSINAQLQAMREEQEAQ